MRSPTSLDDATGRALYQAVCKSRVQGEMKALTRRAINQARSNFVRERLSQAMEQSFSMEALEQRWGYESPTPREEEEEEESGEN